MVIVSGCRIYALSLLSMADTDLNRRQAEA
jgi:hypothetical protein